MECIINRPVNKNLLNLLLYLRRNYTNVEAKYRNNNVNILNKNKQSHPYGKIHNWRSKKVFCDDILKQVIYNKGKKKQFTSLKIRKKILNDYLFKDGLVGINKPYGISARTSSEEPNSKKFPSGIPHEVDYTLTDVLPLLSKELSYESLCIIRTPER